MSAVGSGEIVLLPPTVGLSSAQRFNSAEVSIQSQSWECRHGKHYEVVVRNKVCGHEHVIHRTCSYREHWAAMYDASERLIMPALRGSKGASS